MVLSVGKTTSWGTTLPLLSWMSRASGAIVHVIPTRNIHPIKHHDRHRLVLYYNIMFYSEQLQAVLEISENSAQVRGHIQTRGRRTASGNKQFLLSVLWLSFVPTLIGSDLHQWYNLDCLLRQKSVKQSVPVIWFGKTPSAGDWTSLLFKYFVSSEGSPILRSIKPIIEIGFIHWLPDWPGLFGGTRVRHMLALSAYMHVVNSKEDLWRITCVLPCLQSCFVSRKEASNR